MITKQFFNDSFNNCIVTEKTQEIDCCFFERSRISETFSHEYTENIKNNCCIYILWNKTETNPTIYIGKARHNQITNRINSHNREKDFWKNAVVFSSGTFGDADIEWIEAILIQKARKYQRCNLYNKKEEDSCDRLNESERQETAKKISWFVKNVLRNKLGIDVFISIENSWKYNKSFALLNYYEMLEIGMTASDMEIKKAYKLKSMHYHPDRNIGDTDSQDKQRLLNEAYEILSDSSKRKVYDSKIIAEEIAADEAEKKRKAEEAAAARRKSYEEAQNKTRRQYDANKKSYTKTQWEIDYEKEQLNKASKQAAFKGFVWGGFLSLAASIIIIAPLIKKMADYDAYIYKLKVMQEQLREEELFVKTNESNSQNKWNELNLAQARKEDVLNNKIKETTNAKSKYDQMIIQAERNLKDSDLIKKQSEVILAEAVKEKDKIIDEVSITKDIINKQKKETEEKLSKTALQEKMNIDYKKESITQLNAELIKLERNILAYDKAEGGFIDVFQNRLPSNIRDVQKELDNCKKAMSVFPNDIELMALTTKASMLIDKARKRAPAALR
jgi:curved DNA-binding protein CbpA